MNHEILAQRAIFFFALVTGYYLIICPPTNYYGIISTMILVFTFGGGILANHRSHRDARERPHSYSPTVSVIIPVKDEERNIYHTIKAYSQMKYPVDKLEILVVNDGSQDSTWSEIERAIGDFPSIMIKAFSLKVNRGKRKALAVGIRSSRGEIIVTTDSDTFVDSEAIQELVRPFMDASVAAATGHAYAKNRSVNVLTKMQAGLYYYAYEVVRSFESMFGTVLCCPGTLSAYRKQSVMKILNEWEEAKPILGEDRHLTYLLLRDGYRTVYVEGAVCETIVPETITAYLSQQIRWAKGYIIETYRGCRYMFQRHPIVAASYYMQYFLTLYLPLAIVRIFILFGTSPYWWDYFVFVGTTFLAKAVYCYYQSKDKNHFAMMFFLLINLLMNAWRVPLALLSISEKTRWTRGNVGGTPSYSGMVRLQERNQANATLSHPLMIPHVKSL